MAAKFELYQDTASEWRWRLRHDNGEIVADSGEGYASKAGAKNGIKSVKENAPFAQILGIASKGTFVFYGDVAGEWRWRLVHQNGNIIADSGEGYTRRQGAMNGIDSVQDNAASAVITEL